MRQERQRPMVRGEDVMLEKKKIIRPEIWRFARAMEEQMKFQDRTRGDSWKKITVAMFESRMANNLLKFIETKDRRHLVDVANYAMMTYHKNGEARGGSNGNRE